MKNSIIGAIYNNGECISQQVALSKEYKKASDKTCALYKQLSDVLNDEPKKIFADFIDSEIYTGAEGEFLYFKAGLQVGLRLAMECLI